MDDPSSLLAKAFFILVAALFLVIVAIAIRAIAADARRRGKSPVLVVLLCLLSFPLGLIIWLVFRPQLVNRGRRRFPLQDQRAQ